MRRPTFIGAALAVALVSAGAQAQEGFFTYGESTRPALEVEQAASKTKVDAKEKEAADGDGGTKRQTKGAVTDPTTTASTPKRTKVELVAKKKTKVDLVAKEKRTTVASVASAPRSGKYGTIVARYASTYGVPVSLAHAVIRIESNYRVDALGRAGEVGLMQIKPATARGIGYTGSTKALYHPETNIRWGMKYLGQAHKLGGGSTCGTILKYNAGHGARRMNPISAAYCAKVKRHMGG